MLADKISDITETAGQTVKSIIKLILQSRRPSVTNENRGGRPLIILGNGPSLSENISKDMDILTTNDTMAVNFAGNTEEFRLIRPRYYLLMDPYFFTFPPSDPRVNSLYKHFNEDVDWDMTLFIPTSRDASDMNISNPHIHIEKFNPVGVEGADWLVKIACDNGRGLPRPRNVMIPAIMTAIWMGYKEIYLLGADHSWLKTLDVDDDNNVVSIQPHFYKDGEEEHKRVATMFRDTHLHQLLWGFHLAFKGYHAIGRYISDKEINIYNSTPGSYIDAFPRRNINILRKH